MHLVAEGEATALIVGAEPGVRIGLTRRSLFLAGATRGTCDHRGVDQCALLDQKAPGLELALQFGEQALDQSVLGQTLPEPPDRAVVRRRVLK